MKWIVLPYSESYFEKTKYFLVKFYQFSCNEDYYYYYYLIFQPLLYANVPAESPSYVPTFFNTVYKQFKAHTKKSSTVKSCRYILKYCQYGINQSINQGFRRLRGLVVLHYVVLQCILWCLYLN